MANELRVRDDGVAGALSAALAAGATTMTSDGLIDLAVIDTTNHALITLMERDSNGRVTKLEIVKVTAHASGASTATISRAHVGTDQPWSIGDKWIHGYTATDMTNPQSDLTAGAFGGLTMGDWAGGTQAGFAAFPPGGLSDPQCNFRGDVNGNSVFNARAGASVFTRVGDVDRLIIGPSDATFHNVPTRYLKEQHLVNVTRPASTAGAALLFGENGQAAVRNADGTVVPVSEVKRLTADMAANSSNTVATDITGLSFPIAAGEQVDFEARIRHSSAATTTGLVLILTGPAQTLYHAEAWTWTSATAIVRAAATGSGGAIILTGVVAVNADQWAYLTGSYKAVAAGTVQMAYRSEVNASAVTVKAGSRLSVISRG